MESVDASVWLQACEALARGVIGPYQQCNVVDGEDCLREYCDGPTVVMRMRVCGSNSDKHANECERLYWVAEAIANASAHIYIPTDEELETANDEETALGVDTILPALIAEMEAGS